MTTLPNFADDDSIRNPTEKVRILVFPVGRTPYVVTVARGEMVDRLHDLIGGYFDSIRVNPEGTLRLFVHDEGAINGLPPNLLINRTPVHGVVVLARNDASGEAVDLTSLDIAEGSATFPRFRYVERPREEVN
jgi:hypothetical protein